MSKIRGNKTLSGTWGEVWVDGEKIFELSKVELKITANREDVQLGLDVDSKMTIAAIKSGLTSCPSSPWKWVVLSSRRLAAALPRPTL